MYMHVQLARLDCKCELICLFLPMSLKINNNAVMTDIQTLKISKGGLDRTRRWKETVADGQK